MAKKKGKERMSEEEKRKKFGDKYDPNFGKNKPKGKERDEGIPDENDWEWYAITEQIAKDVGSLPFSHLSGAYKRFQFSRQAANGQSKIVQFGWKERGLMRIGYVNAQFSDGDSTSGINLATQQLYTFVRHANSGAKTYEAPDLMIYILGLRDIYREYCECKRVIGLAQYYTFDNMYLPELLIGQGCNIDVTDLINNIAKYRGTLNLIATKINSLAAPKYFKAFERTAYIASSVFMDSSSSRGQYYVFNADMHYEYSATTSEAGSTLVCVPNNEAAFTDEQQGATITLGDKLQRLTNMVNLMRNDTDMTTMSGDILKAFKDADLYQLAQTDENYIVTPNFDENILAQIENMDGCSFIGLLDPTMAVVDSLNVTQRNGQLIWTPFWNVTLTEGERYLGIIPNQTIFNSHKDEPDYKDVLEWSRLKATFTTTLNVSGKETIVNLALTSCGLELATSIRIFGGPHPCRVNQWVQVLNPNGTTETRTDRKPYIQAMALAQFDWHPIQYVVEYNDNQYDTVYAMYVVGDLKKFTTVAKSTVEGINHAAVAAAFYARGLYGQNAK